MTEIEKLRLNLTEVRRKIFRAAARVGRQDAEKIKLIAVSKTFSAEVVQNAIAAGATDFGENRVQEAEAKIGKLGDSKVKWHLIGNLQANKARKAARLFDLIQTLDSLVLAQRLERICDEEKRSTLEVLIQVDLAGEATKSGAKEIDLPPLTEFLQNAAHLKLKGLMIIPPYFEDAEKARPFFRRLRQLRDRIFPDAAGELSMGMSHDFEIAVEEGATIVRVGTAIFGKRK
jgi:pyridoxal phosphate enzyme (YggS family)